MKYIIITKVPLNLKSSKMCLNYVMQKVILCISEYFLGIHNQVNYLNICFSSICIVKSSKACTITIVCLSS